MDHVIYVLIILIIIIVVSQIYLCIALLDKPTKEASETCQVQPAKPIQPVNVYLPPPQPQQIRVNIDTNGTNSAPDNYPQVGYLKSYETNLALYGSQSAMNRNRYFYYAIVNHIKIPIFRTSPRSKDCMGEYGCEELYSEDIVEIPDAMSNPWEVKLYNINRR